MDSLAKLQPSLPVIPIGKSQWRIGCSFALVFLGILSIGPLIIFTWLKGYVVIALVLSFMFTAICLSLPQLVQVAACEQSPLVLEAEGLRVNFVGDFIRYDQITKVTFSSYESSGRLALRLVPGVKFRSNRIVYRLFGHPHFLALYTISVNDLAGEIERRKKAFDDAKP